MCALILRAGRSLNVKKFISLARENGDSSIVRRRPPGNISRRRFAFSVRAIRECISALQSTALTSKSRVYTAISASAPAMADVERIKASTLDQIPAFSHHPSPLSPLPPDNLLRSAAPSALLLRVLSSNTRRFASRSQRRESRSRTRNSAREISPRFHYR